MEMQIARISRAASSGTKLSALLTVMLGIAGWSQVAKGVVILPGTLGTPTGSGGFTGTLLADTGSENFTGLGVGGGVVFLGTFDAQVYKDSSTGDLDFVYQFANNANSVDSIESMTAGGFTTFTTDADYIPATGVVPPTQVTRSGSGNNVGFEFPGAGAVAPGANTDRLVIKTNATAFTGGFAVIQDGGNGSAADFTPAVPEPTTIALAGATVLMLGFRRPYGQPR